MAGMGQQPQGTQGILNSPALLGLGLGMLGGSMGGFKPANPWAGGLEGLNLGMGWQTARHRTQLANEFQQAQLQQMAQVQQQRERQRAAVQALIGKPGDEQVGPMPPGATREKYAPTGLYASSPELAKLVAAMPPETAAQQLLAAQTRAQAAAAPSGAMKTFAGFQKLPKEKQEAFLAYMQASSPFAGMRAFFEQPLGKEATNWRHPETGQKATPEMTPQEATKKGMIYSQPATAEERKSIAQGEMALNLVSDIESLIDQGVDTGSGTAFQFSMSASPWTSWVPGTDLNENEAKLGSSLEQLSNLMLAAVRGAQVGPAEQARFEKQLPRLGQDKEVFKANLQYTKDNLQMLLKRGAELRAGATPGMLGGGEDKAATPQTQAEYDALPSGALFIDPQDGKRYRKP